MAEIYTDTISALEEEPKPGGVTPAKGPYGEIIQGLSDVHQDAAQAATFVGSQVKPDHAAKAADIGRKLGLPGQTVESNLPAYESQAKSIENSAILRGSPMLASWIAANPEAARIAHDDFQNLGFLEKVMHSVKAGWSQGVQSDALAKEGAYQLMEGGEIKETQYERGLKQQLTRPDGVDGGFYSIIKDMSSFLGGFGVQAKEAAPMALGGAMIGTAVPVVGETGIGTGAGAVAGFTAGMVKEGFESGAGQIYNQLKMLKDEDGQPIDPTLIRGAAYTGGLLLGALNAFNIQVLNKPFAEAMGSIIPTLAKKVVERPAMGMAMKNFGKTMGTGALVGAEFGAMSQVIMTGAMDIAKRLDSPEKWQTIFNSEAARSKFLDDVVDSMESTALAFSVLHAPPASVNLGVDIARARRAGQEQQFIRALADGAAASKVRERSPSAFESFMAHQTDGTPVENLYIPAEVVMKLYQEAGLDPKDRGTDHLFPFVQDMDRQLEQALPAKGDVVIKTSEYATHIAGTDIDVKLKNDMRVSADSMTMNEAKQFFQDVKKELGERAAELKTELTKPEEAGEKIKAEVQKQLEEAGYKGRTAGGMAAQMAAFFQTVGKRLGIDPMGLFQRYGMKIERKEGAMPEGSIAADFEQAANDDLGYPKVTHLITNPLKEFSAGMKEEIAERVKQMKEKAAAWDGWKFDVGDRVQGKHAVYEITGRWWDIKNDRPMYFYKSDYMEQKGSFIAEKAHESMQKMTGPTRLEQKNDTGRLEMSKAFRGEDLGDIAAQVEGLVDEGKKPRVEKLKPSQVRATQDWTDYADGGGGDPVIVGLGDKPVVVKTADGMYHVIDGHHRFDTAAKTDKAVDAYVVDYDITPEDNYKQEDPIAKAFAAAMEGKKAPPRGYITIGGDRKISISFLEKADLSTFLHESGHAYLEILRDLTSKPGTPLDFDVSQIFNYLGVKGWKELNADTNAGRAAHEKFARSFEAYLMEGKAPSRELRGVFARFKNWLTTIYQQMSNLNVELTDGVRAVFDRLLATDEEIIAARRAQRLEVLFKDAKSAGMSDAEFAAYRSAVKRATEDADDKLLNKVMGDVRRSRTEAWKSERARMREEELARVNQRPDIQALHFLRTGEMLDGRKDIPPMKLSRQALESAYGSDILADMPRGRPGRPLVVAKDGVHPDDVAQLFGYESGDAMVKGLIALERKARKNRAVDERDTRSVRDMLVDESTDRRMKRENGDMLDDGNIKDEAMAAIHSERQAEVLATELRALTRTAKSDRPMPFTVARDWARATLAGKTTGEVSKYFRFAREEGKAARAVEKALLAGDAKEAMRQKQLQLLNHVLYMESRKAADEIAVAQRRLDGYASARVLKSVDPDYLDQVHQLLERFDFATVSDKEVEKRESLARWIDRMEAEGNEIKISDRLRSEAFRKHYSKLTLDEFRGLTDAADNIIHIGKLKNKLTDIAEQRDLFEVVGDAVAQVANLRQKIPPEQRNPGAEGKGLDRISAKWLKLKSAVTSMDAALLKMEQVFDWLDQGDSNGVFNRIVFKRIADAGIVENDLRAGIAKKLAVLNKRMPKEFREDFNTRYEIAELVDSRTGKPSQMLKSEILAIALNVGNASNFDKLLRGEKWAESAVNGVLDRHMTKADWQFVQGVWDVVGELWPKIADMEKRMSGVAPEKIEPREFETQHGTMKGGYYPVVYDPLRSYDVELNRQKSADTLFERNYLRATTPHGYTIERAQPYARPLYLSMEVLPRHLQQVTHDLAYREAVMESDKFLANPKIRKAVEETLGREIYMQFRPWLQAIANDKVYDQRGLAWWDKAAHWARTSATMVGLGFRLSTMLIHGLTAASNSVGELGPKWMMSGVKAFFGTPEKMAAARDFIFERSGEMRNRMNDVDRDVRDGLADLEGKHGPIYAARRFAYYGISALDMASALPTWMGAYNKALAGGMAEEQAVYAADKSVRVAHGAGHIKDLPAIQRGSEWQKLFTMFYSFWSHFYNRQRHMGRQMVEAGHLAAEGEVKKAAQDFSMVLARSVFYFILPQMIHAAIRTKGKSDEGKDFPELAAEEIAIGFFAGIPVLRDVAHAAFLGKDYEATPAAQIVKSLGASAKDFAAVTGMSDRELSDHWVKHAMETAGYTFGLPLGQPAGSVQFLWDVMHGDADPKGITDWMHGIMYGKLEEGK